MVATPRIAEQSLRIALLIDADNAPAASAIASPRNCRAVVSPLKPSLNATATAAKAITSPTHCMPRSRSVGTKRGSSNATTHGEV